MNDLKKLKLRLTIALMNNKGKNAIQTVKDFMHNVKEAGKFLGLQLVKRAELDTLHTQKTYALKFENFTLHLRMIANQSGNYQTINGFQLS